MQERSSEWWVIGSLVVCGAIPWLGYLLNGSWNDQELGLATLVLIFTVRAAWSQWRAKTTPSHPP